MKKRTLALLLSALLALMPLSGCDVAAQLAQQSLGTSQQTSAAPEATECLPLIDPADAAADTAAPAPDEATPAPDETPDEHGAYTSKEDVALYLHVYGRLPENFIKKTEARALGWSGGGLDAYAYGMCIGGDRFGNNEGLLPEKSGRTYTECDIGTLHKSSRGAERIVFSNDGLIYYTGDHYTSFTLLYGEE